MQLWANPTVVSHTNQPISGGTQDVVVMKVTFAGDGEAHLHTVTRNDYGSSVTVIHRVQRWQNVSMTPPYFIDDTTRSTTITKSAPDSQGRIPCAMVHTAPNGTITKQNATVKPNTSPVFPGLTGNALIRAIFKKKRLMP